MPPQVIHVKNASKVAAALANEKCQRILEHLNTHKDATESQLSKALSIPLSTVHYNMKVLVDAKLVLDNEYSYSEKGKEVTHYKLNKNPIVIIQEESQFDALKALVPAAIISAGVGIAYWFATKTAAMPQAAPMMAKSMPVEEVAADGAMLMMQSAPAALEPVAQPAMLPWFLAGVAITLVLALLALFIQKRWRR